MRYIGPSMGTSWNRDTSDDQKALSGASVLSAEWIRLAVAPDKPQIFSIRVVNPSVDRENEAYVVEWL